jgi:hypothetical protein
MAAAPAFSNLQFVLMSSILFLVCDSCMEKKYLEMKEWTIW